MLWKRTMAGRSFRCGYRYAASRTTPASTRASNFFARRRGLVRKWKGSTSSCCGKKVECSGHLIEGRDFASACSRAALLGPGHLSVKGISQVEAVRPTGSLASGDPAGFSIVAINSDPHPHTDRVHEASWPCRPGTTPRRGWRSAADRRHRLAAAQIQHRVAAHGAHSGQRVRAAATAKAKVSLLPPPVSVSWPRLAWIRFCSPPTRRAMRRRPASRPPRTRASDAASPVGSRFNG